MWWGHRRAGAHTAANTDEPLRHILEAEIARRRKREFMQRLVRRLSSVTGFQIMYYAWFFQSGIYGVFIANSQPPVTLEGVPHISVQLWYWLNIAGPMFGAAGIWLERTKFNYAGLWIQVGGNVMFAWSLLAYILATLQVESWGHGMYGGWLGAASLTSTVCLVLRDGLRIELRRSGE